MRKGGDERKGKKAFPSFYNLRRSGGRLPMGQGLNSEYSARANRGYHKLQDSPRFHAKDSGSRKLRVQEVSAELTRVVAHASRGMDSSHFGYFPF